MCARSSPVQSFVPSILNDSCVAAGEGVCVRSGGGRGAIRFLGGDRGPGPAATPTFHSRRCSVAAAVGGHSVGKPCTAFYPRATLPPRDPVATDAGARGISAAGTATIRKNF